jgi:DNA-binding beta-propeller fold protein YncE
VADCGNDRIQLFQPGELNGTTIAGTGAPNTIDLNCPSGVLLDGDDYLFIVDNGNHRIVGEGVFGFRCIVGCQRQGSASYQLSNPQTMAFDRHGNIYVTDTGNSRVQKFLLVTNLYSKFIIHKDF